ncbi:MAG TPA: hypothetical protein VKN99_16655 [Polyangia bacterium]|nr:hypothetical protein [Polyangia bacterium]
MKSILHPVALVALICAPATSWALAGGPKGGPQKSTTTSMSSRRPARIGVPERTKGGIKVVDPMLPGSKLRTDHIKVNSDDPQLRVTTGFPKYGRGNIVIRGIASDTGIVPSFIRLTLPPYWVGGPVRPGEPPHMAPAQTIELDLTKNENAESIANRLSAKIDGETGFQGEVQKMKDGGYRVVVRDKMRALAADAPANQ